MSSNTRGKEKKEKVLLPPPTVLPLLSPCSAFPCRKAKCQKAKVSLVSCKLVWHFWLQNDRKGRYPLLNVQAALFFCPPGVT